jgi:hypothetical protein
MGNMRFVPRAGPDNVTAMKSPRADPHPRKGLARAELAILADHPGLDRAAADNLDDTRNNAEMGQ